MSSPPFHSINHHPPASFPSYYHLLAVDPSASQKDIEKAYKRQALLHHPDRNRSDSQSESTQKFQQLIEAYDVLKDSSKRKKYDLKIALTPGFVPFSSSRHTPSRSPPTRDSPASHHHVPPMPANSTSTSSHPRSSDTGVHAKPRSASDMFAEFFRNSSSPPHPSPHSRPPSVVPSLSNPRPPKPTVLTSPYVSPYVKAPSAAKRPRPQVPTFYPRSRHAPSPAIPPLRASPTNLDPPPLRERRNSTNTTRPPTISPSRPSPDTYQTSNSWQKSIDHLIAGLNLSSNFSVRSTPDLDFCQGSRSAKRPTKEAHQPGPRSTTRAPEDDHRLGPRSTTRAPDQATRSASRSTTRATMDGPWPGPRSTTRAADQAACPGPRPTTRAAEDGSWSGLRSTTRATEEGQRPRQVHRLATMRDDGRSERQVRSSSTTGLHREHAGRHSSEWYDGSAYVRQHHQPDMADERMQRRQTVYQSPLSASVGSPTSSHGLGAGSSACTTPTTSVEDSLPSPRPGARSRSATLDGRTGGDGGLQMGGKREFREVVYRYELVGDGKTRVSRELRSRTIDVDGTVRDRYRRQRAAVGGIEGGF